MNSFNNKTLVILSLLIVLILLVFLLLMIEFGGNVKNNVEKMSDESKPITKQEIPYQALYTSPGMIQSYNPMHSYDDIIREYDFRKAYDPFEIPGRRIARHEIHPLHLKRLIDIPTRGYPDNFTQIGILVKEGNPKKNEDNKILRLYGRQEFPGSNRYEYYSAISSGNDIIKIPIYIKKQELYDDDIVHIKELNDHYRVQLHRYDQPKYYPDIIY